MTCPCCLAETVNGVIACPCEVVADDTMQWCKTHHREPDGSPPDPYDNPTEAWPEVLRWF